jgi:hypothetical protein
LTIHGIRNLEGAALGNSLSRLMQSMPQLQRLKLRTNRFGVDSVHAMQPALRTNQTLVELCLSNYGLEDVGIRLIADALVGNTIMEVLNISWNNISANGLPDITRMLKSMPRLDTMYLQGNPFVFVDEDATQHFVTTLHQTKSSVQELPLIRKKDFPVNIRDASYASIQNSLIRNQQLNRVALLLAPPPLPPLQRQQHATRMMLKISHKSITKFATIPNNAGASAIFKLLQARPAILEKRLRQPAVATLSRLQHDSLSHDGSNGSPLCGRSSDDTGAGGQKRRRLYGT